MSLRKYHRVRSGYQMISEPTSLRSFLLHFHQSIDSSIPIHIDWEVHCVVTAKDLLLLLVEVACHCVDRISGGCWSSRRSIFLYVRMLTDLLSYFTYKSIESTYSTKFCRNLESTWVVNNFRLIRLLGKSPVTRLLKTHPPHIIVACNVVARSQQELCWTLCPRTVLLSTREFARYGRPWR